MFCFIIGVFEMFKIILFIIMLIAFIFNFTGPKFLKHILGYDNISINQVNNIKLLSLLIVIICAVLLVI